MIGAEYGFHNENDYSESDGGDERWENCRIWECG